MIIKVLLLILIEPCYKKIIMFFVFCFLNFVKYQKIPSIPSTNQCFLSTTDGQTQNLLRLIRFIHSLIHSFIHYLQYYLYSIPNYRTKNPKLVRAVSLSQSVVLKESRKVSESCHVSYCDWDNITVLGVCCRQMHVLPGYVFADTGEVLVGCAGSVSGACPTRVRLR